MVYDDRGNLYIADNEDNVLYLLDSNRKLHRIIDRKDSFSPETIYFAKGSLYITDSHNGKLYVFTPGEELKTIAAFLNSREGGILVIGIKDDREALGVEADGFPNEDKMNLHLVNLIKARLGAASMLNIKPHFEDYKGKRLLVVDCLSSSSPVYLKNGNTEEFYIRAGASSAALAASEMTNYIQQRYT